MSPRNKYTVVISDPAQADLEEIAAYTAQKWQEAQAVSYLEEIYQTITTLEQNPDKGRQRYGIPAAIKGIAAGKHVIFYRADRLKIYILRILHERMDFGRHIG